MTNATRSAQLRPSYTAQLNSQVHRKGKIPKMINHVIDALRANNYPSYVTSSILKRKFSKPPTHAISSPEELVCIFLSGLRLKGTLTVLLPSFINGVTQLLTRILRRHDIRVVNKPLKTLQQEFLPPKFRPPIEHQPNVIYN